MRLEWRISLFLLACLLFLLLWYMIFSLQPTRPTARSSSTSSSPSSLSISSTSSCHYTSPDCDQECEKTPSTFRIFAYYQNWGSCYTSYNTLDAGEPKPDVFQQVISLDADEIAFAFCLLSVQNVEGNRPTPLSPYLLYSGVNGQRLASFASETVLSQEGPFQALLTSFAQPIRVKGKTPFLGFGGWSDNTDFSLALPPGVSSWTSVGRTMAKVCNALGCGVVLDFEHLSQPAFPLFEKQLPGFVSMIQGIHDTLEPTLPFHFCTRYNGCLTESSRPPAEPVLPNESDNEFAKILTALGNTCRDWFTGVQIMAYDDPTRMKYDNIVLNFQDAGVPPSLVYMGAEIGRQADNVGWPGASDDLLVLDAVKTHGCRGVMLWAMNPSNDESSDVGQCAYRIAPAMMSFYRKGLTGTPPDISPCEGSLAVCNANASLVQAYDPKLPSVLQCPPPVSWPYPSCSPSR